MQRWLVVAKPLGTPGGLAGLSRAGWKVGCSPQVRCSAHLSPRGPHPPSPTGTLCLDLFVGGDLGLQQSKSQVGKRDLAVS